MNFFGFRDVFPSTSPSLILFPISAQHTIARVRQRKIDADRVGGREGQKSGRAKAYCGEKRQGGRQRHVFGSTSDDLSPENQGRNIERQDKETEEKPAPAQPDCQRSPESPDHRQRRRPEKEAQDQPAIPPAGRFRNTASPGAKSG